MKIEVLYIADCPNHEPVVERVREVMCAAGIEDMVLEVEVLSTADAEQWKFVGSPTVRINGLDVETEARSAQHFGLGCRSYAEDGHRSGMPSRELIWRALQESLGGPPSLPSVRPMFIEPTPTPTKGSESSVLAVGGIAAILASACCLGPLILVALGFSGAWIGNLAILEPYRPWFIGAALLALFLAGRRIFRNAEACAPGEVCALPTTRRAYKAIFGIVAALVVVALAFPYVARLFY
jgi:mercuric ion transport protein